MKIELPCPLNSNLAGLKNYTYNTTAPCNDDEIIAQLVAYIKSNVPAYTSFIITGLNLNAYYYIASGYRGEPGYYNINLNTGLNAYIVYIANGQIYSKNKVAIGNVIKDQNNQGLSMFLNTNNGILTIMCNGSSYDYARI